MKPYQIIQAHQSEVPIIISVPHCGRLFPDDIKKEFDQDLIQSPDDTDWFVDRLYDFAPALGITMITATYSRWVIDLNRHPESKPLYADGRMITGLCPTTTFLGQPLYKDGRTELSKSEQDLRLEKYYWPYHYILEDLLHTAKAQFGKVLLWDCHSIRQQVPTLHNGKFPDLILGDSNEISAAFELIRSAQNTLQKSSYSFSHNHPFKGGYITRYYGRPEFNQSALQLEMSKINYMDDAEINYHPERAERMRDLLKSTFEQLIYELNTD